MDKGEWGGGGVLLEGHQEGVTFVVGFVLPE